MFNDIYCTICGMRPKVGLTVSVSANWRVNLSCAMAAAQRKLFLSFIAQARVAMATLPSAGVLHSV
eukprot:1161465-Pelagomonas_calceolata.AAC.4